MRGEISMEFGTANRLSGSPKAMQGQQSRDTDTASSASFFDTISAKAAESEKEAIFESPAEGKKTDYALPWESREMARSRRKRDLWINQIRKQRMEAERRAYWERHEEYVKMLKASSLKRSLQESANRRYHINSVARDVALSAYGVEYKKQYGGFF